MRIHFLLPGIHVSGGVICVLRHAAGLQARGHEVVVFSQTPWPEETLSYLPEATRDVPIQLQGGPLPEADIQIATHHNTALPVVQSPARLRAHFLQHNELIFAVGSPQASTLIPYVQMAQSLPLYRIANSKWAADTVERLTGKRPDQTTNAVSLPVAPRPKLGSLAAPVQVLSFTHPELWKGTQDATDAMSLARSIAPELDLQWVVFGGGHVPEAHWIHPQGMVAHDALPDLYRKASALLFTSWAESYPLPPIEAMASGCPVITTPFGVEGYVRAGENAIVIPPRDPQAAAHALVRLLRGPVARRQELVDAGLETARLETWDKAVLSFEQALRRGLGAPPAPDPTPDLLRKLGLPVIGA